MSEIKQLPTRDEVPTSLTWDLTKIFKDDAAFDAAYNQLTEELNQAESFKGTLGNGADAFLAALEYVLDVYRKVETLYVYSHLKNDQDTTNTAYQALYARASSLYAQVSEAVSWFDPEVLTLSDEQIWGYFEEQPKLAVYRHYIQNILDERPHVLSMEQEALLAGASEIFGASSNTFSILNNADLEFPTVQNAEGETIQLSHGVYGQLMESVDPSVREAAFKGLYKVYKQFRNTLASTLGAHVKTHNYKAKIRNYDSARAASLASNHIPESVHETLVAVVNKHLPLLHRYVKLRKKLLNVEELHMYDLYAPLLGEAPIRYSYEEAKEKAIEALKPLGEDYLSIVKEAFSSRWIDVIENQGKRSGAYSSGAYDTAPYILMNWHDSLDQLFTLVHEMGHLDGFKGTIFRQTQFAEFEHFIHTEDAKGTPLTSEYLSEYYGELNAKYYGPEVVRDEEISYEWARIPHFYYNYYVYQYATGFSAASALSKHILAEEEGALEKYLNYLKAGSSDFPIEVMKKAGVDMTQAAYIEDAMKVFEERLTELEALVEKL